MPNVVDDPQGDQARSDYATIPANDNLDDGPTGVQGLIYNNISRGPRCGSPQYPPPFKTTTKEDDERSKTLPADCCVPSGYTGFNGYSDSGNVCITPGQRDFISGRGGNAKCADYTHPFVKYDAAGCSA